MSHAQVSEWILVDRIFLSARATKFSFKTGGDGALNYPISGNLDGGYRLTWDLLGDASSGLSGFIELNGANTNQTYDRMVGTGGGGFTAATGSEMGLYANTASASNRHVGEWVMEASVTGATRLALLFRSTFSTTIAMEQDLCKYNDSSTNITALDFTIAAGNATGTVWLYVKSPQQAGIIT